MQTIMMPNAMAPAFWATVEDCLIRFHHLDARCAAEKVFALKSNLQRGVGSDFSPLSFGNMIYHSEPWSIACNLAGRDLPLAEYQSVYEDLLQRNESAAALAARTTTDDFPVTRGLLTPSLRRELIAQLTARAAGSGVLAPAAQSRSWWLVIAVCLFCATPWLIKYSLPVGITVQTLSVAVLFVVGERMILWRGSPAETPAGVKNFDQLNDAELLAEAVLSLQRSQK